MPFPRRLLSEDEQLVLDLRPHWIALVAPLFETALIVAGVALALAYLPNGWPTWVRWAVVIAGLFLFLWRPVRHIVAWATSHFVVTTDRVVHRSGWFAKHSMEIPLENISDVRFNQSVFERVIGAGDLTLESPGEFGQETFSNVRKPESVQKTIYEMTESNRRRMMAPAGLVASAAPTSVADELAKLDRLRDEGVISDEEFEAQKARLLRQS
ncbi:MAG TPA: PH domain-containing protein [Actinomycetota bacterium]